MRHDCGGVNDESNNKMSPAPSRNANLTKYNSASRKSNTDRWTLHGGRNGVPRPRRAHPGRRAVHRPAGPCADEDAGHGIVRPMPTLRQARHQNGQGVSMLYQPAREIIRRHMEGHGGMRLARLNDRSRQNRHRLHHTPTARRTEGQFEGFHLKEGQQIRRLARRQQGSRRHLRLWQ